MTEKRNPLRVISGMKFYIPSDIARILDLTEYTVRYYLRQKKLKGVRLGGRWYISEANFKAFLGGGRFFDQSDDRIMDSINEAIKMTFESNVKWLAFEVKKLIIDDLIKNFRDNLEEINRIAGIPGGVNKIMEEREKKLKKEFIKV
jgi:predicted transcriptional regulator